MQAIRTTMLALLRQLRLMIGDPYRHEQVFTDEELQEQLDRAVFPYRQWALAEKPTIDASGATQYRDYYALEGGNLLEWWEDSAVIQSGNGWTQITPDASSNPCGGYWALPGVAPICYVSGLVYDLNRAASELLRFWASKYSTRFDFIQGDVRVMRLPVAKELREQADYFEAKARAKTASLTRSDAWGLVQTWPLTPTNYKTW